MNIQFFWPKGIYSGIYPPLPPQDELSKAVYVVKYYPVDNKNGKPSNELTRCSRCKKTSIKKGNQYQLVCFKTN